MFINKIRLVGLKGFPGIIKISAFGKGSGGRYQFYFGIALLENLLKQSITLYILFIPLLITHPEETQVKGSRMTHIRADFAPFRGYGSVSKLDKIECILDIGIEFGQTHYFTAVELTGHAAVQDWQRGGTEVFGQLKIFIEAQSKTLVIVRSILMGEFHIPAVHDQFAVFRRSYGCFPLVAVREVTSFYYTTTGKTKKARF